MTLYFRNPEMIAESRRRMLRKMMDETYNTDRVLSFPLEMKATENDYTLKAMLPGLSAEEINIRYEDSVLTIDGEYTSISEEGKECLFSEMPVGRFSRSIEIKEPIVVDKIEASMKDGILTILIPKAEEAKPKMIKINAK
ncbi:MAG TPA: Hsp20/alpha crystallin family protein [Anaerolineaceae bacterium]|nr:Hsp20/alpha crystallin family protein [Anaerolineaceae bacterium]